MNYRIRARRFYWRWYGELDLADGPTLRLSGDVARWLRPGDEVQLQPTGDPLLPVLAPEEFTLLRRGTPVWPPFSEEVIHRRDGVYTRSLFERRLRLREASREEDFEAVAALERYHGINEGRSLAIWRCPDGARIRADERPVCQAGSGRLLQIRGSTPASRFLLLEAVAPDPGEPRLLGYLRIDPPLPVMLRRSPGGVQREIREAVFPPDWFRPTFDLKQVAPAGRSWQESAQELLDRVETGAARIGRILIHPEYRSQGLGSLLAHGGLQWTAERSLPDGRRQKHLLGCTAGAARHHPFLEKAGFRYLWDTASGRPLLAAPLTDAAVGRLRRFLQNDPQAREHGGRLYRPAYPRASGLSGPILFREAEKSLAAELGASNETMAVLGAFGAARKLRRRILPPVSLRIRPATINLLTGSNEAGKHALIRLLWDEMPDGGWVDVPPDRVAAFIPGVSGSESEEETVFANLTRRLESAPAAVELLGRLGLADPIFWQATPDQLPASQRERYFLALLLAGRPDLLLLDDFAARQSPAGGRNLSIALSRLAREAGITLVVSSPCPGVPEALEPDVLIHVGYDTVHTEQLR